MWIFKAQICSRIHTLGEAMWGKMLNLGWWNRSSFNLIQIHEQLYFRNSTVCSSTKVKFGMQDYQCLNRWIAVQKVAVWGIRSSCEWVSCVYSILIWCNASLILFAQQSKKSYHMQLASTQKGFLDFIFRCYNFSY